MRSSVVVGMWVMVLLVPHAVAVVMNCHAVMTYLSPCAPYVTKNSPLGRCCWGVKQLKKAATLTRDRQTVCRCLKALANSSWGYNHRKAASIPRMCRVYVPYPISADIDCSKVR